MVFSSLLQDRRRHLVFLSIPSLRSAFPYNSIGRDQERVQGEKGFPVFCTGMGIVTNLPNMILILLGSMSVFKGWPQRAATQ